jgi:DNA-binding response OmpR family regulator
MTPIEILLIEDNPGDIELVREGFEEARVANHLSIIGDGQAALDFFIKGENLPDIILLDINLPKANGFEILETIRSQPKSAEIPVIMLTSSEADSDVVKSYQNSANSYVSKPVDFDKFIAAIKSIESFWLSVVKLPRQLNQ